MSVDYPDRIVFREAIVADRVSVRVPGSKSITNRAMLMAALATGRSTLRSVLFSDDTHRMIDGLRAFGVAIDVEDDSTVRIHGCGGKLAESNAVVFTGNSGTTVRFLSAAAALAPTGVTATLDGVERMRSRPIQDLLDALAEWGVDARSRLGTGCPPVEVAGGGIDGGICHVRGNLSSQFLSALLMIAPYSRTSATIVVDGELVSYPYVSMTMSLMKAFGVECSREEDGSFRIPAPQIYRGREYTIEPDASNASYFLGAAAVTGTSVRLEGLGTQSVQGDVAFVDVLEKMGCRIARTGDSLCVTGPPKLCPFTANMQNIPDTAQTAAVLALFADGVSHICGISNLSVKETDRLNATAAELSKMGAQVEVTNSSWTIHPPERGAGPVEIETYDDHRMAMAFAVAGLRVPGLTILDPGCVAKTFPNFWSLWKETFGEHVTGKYGSER